MGKNLIDGGALLVATGSILNALPGIAALFSIAWFAIRIWESNTVGGWVGRGKVTQGEKVEPTPKPPHVENDK